LTTAKIDDSEVDDSELTTAKLTTVFLGTSDFAAAILERLAGSDGHRPALVVTRPDRPRGRGRRPTPPPVAERARALGIPLAQPESVNDPSARSEIAHAAGGDERDLTVVVCAFGALIKEPLLSEHRILNVHPSLLPRWRGAAPVERAIMAGDDRTGVSIMRLTAGLDSGPVCLAAEEPIAPGDTYGSLAARLQDIGGELLLRALDEQPPFAEQPQEGVTYAEKIGPGDRLLDPSRPALELERVVRALEPHVGARVQLPGGTLLGVHRAAITDVPPAGDGERGEADAPGLWSEGERLFLAGTPGTLELLVVQPPGGRSMDACAYLRGHELPGRA
jgi:methionyl-tRNA formyltransferase